MSEKKNVGTTGAALLADAKAAPAGLAATRLKEGENGSLRQNLVAVAAGRQLPEHPSPGDATLFVLEGSVVLRSGDQEWPATRGELIRIPAARHWVDAVEDSIFLVSVATLRTSGE